MFPLFHGERRVLLVSLSIKASFPISPSHGTSRLQHNVAVRAPWKMSRADEETLLRGAVPAMEARPPAMDIAAIRFVVRAELPAKSGLLIQNNKGVDSDGNGQDGGDGRGIGVSEDNPEADPPEGKAEVHGVTDKAIGADNDEMPRGNDRCGCAAACPSEVPDTTQCDGKAQDRGDCGEPAPGRSTGRFHMEAEPLWKNPEPEREEAKPNQEGGPCRQPAMGEWNQQILLMVVWACHLLSMDSAGYWSWGIVNQAQPTCLSANSAFQIFVMCTIFSPSNCMT